MESPFLYGWKNIARHLGKSERTVRRWRDVYGMPVRVTITGRPFVLDFEVDLWMVEVDKAIKKQGGDKKAQKHAAMMRSRKGMSKGC